MIVFAHVVRIGYNLREGGWVDLAELYEDGAITDGHLRRGGKMEKKTEQYLHTEKKDAFRSHRPPSLNKPQ